ncbi:MAG: deoxyguanosinetriphosphate triphosphohydrolase [Endomicrobiia bacterium]
MLIREELEEEEKKTLSKFACLSSNTQGRKTKEEECSVRTVFQRDKDRIIHSQSFRLLKYKTNVFLSSSGERFRTRLTHTLEVSAIARTICRALKLNEDLAEAIALGHDLGHTPFGHTGEDVLDKLSPDGFHHSKQSLRVVDYLEKEGRGLNLTFEVRDGILKHTKGKKSIIEFNGESEFGIPVTLEGKVIQFSDWIAYINHDIDDAISAGLITLKNLPHHPIKILGSRHSQRINSMVCDIVEQSKNINDIKMSKDVLLATEELRRFLYEKVYVMPEIANKQKNAEKVLTKIYKYYSKNYKLLAKEFPWRENIDETAVVDFVAGLTDTKAQEIYKTI